MESIKGYDNWKLRESPSVERDIQHKESNYTHPLCCVGRVGQTAEFWAKNPKGVGGYRYICGNITFADNKVVEISCFGSSTVYYYNDLQPI